MPEFELLEGVGEVGPAGQMLQGGVQSTAVANRFSEKRVQTGNKSIGDG